MYYVLLYVFYMYNIFYYIYVHVHMYVSRTYSRCTHYNEGTRYLFLLNLYMYILYFYYNRDIPGTCTTKAVRYVLRWYTCIVYRGEPSTLVLF
jgi:hypothetical protein